MDNSDRDSVTDERSKANIVKAVKAIEAFVNFGCIATGILQLLALNYEQIIWKGYRGWLRTRLNILSEETVISVVAGESSTIISTISGIPGFTQ